jgi:tRNA threonylcarbamoyl adenosine modification protein YeaZ
MLLAIDTSTEMASLALVQDSNLLAETTWRCGQNHTVQLLPQLTAVLEKAEVDIQGIDAIAVAKGPGSFNGLRVGISTAKGLAYSLNASIIGVSTLEVAAYQHAESSLHVCAIHNAGRSEIAAAVYRMERKLWKQVQAEHITTLDVLLSGITLKTLFCGEYVSSIADEIKMKLKTKAVIPSPPALLRRAFYLADLAGRRLKAGTEDNVATLQPLYLRRPPITERKHH